jgi:hypothetical protein
MISDISFFLQYQSVVHLINVNVVWKGKNDKLTDQRKPASKKYAHTCVNACVSVCTRTSLRCHAFCFFSVHKNFSRKNYRAIFIRRHRRKFRTENEGTPKMKEKSSECLQGAKLSHGLEQQLHEQQLRRCTAVALRC